MKKTIIALTLCSSFLAPAVQADTLFGIYAGAQGWDMDAEGGFSNSSALTEFQYESETKSNFYLAVEHPIPFIPNVKVRRTDMDTGGNTTLSGGFSFGGVLFPTNAEVFTDVALTSTDFILYYEFLDNDLFSFDLGLNGKYVDGSLFVQDNANTSSNAREDFSGMVPMLYSRVAFGIPATGFGVYAEGNFLSVDDHTISDYEVALTYDVIENVAVDVTLQLGYRAVNLELEDLDDIYTDLEFTGVFAGVEVHF